MIPCKIVLEYHVECMKLILQNCNTFDFIKVTTKAQQNVI